MSLINRLLGWRYTLLYILAIPFTNWLLVVTPPIMMPDGTPFTVAVFVVGLVFVLRDFSQREVGSRGALAAIVVAAVITWFMATPALAIASLTAFALGELVDWIIFTWTRKPLADRILWSCLAAAPVDTAVFLIAANPILPGLFTWSALVLYTLGKILVAVAVYYVLQFRKGRGAGYVAA